jgi:hypothetical protein
MGYSVLLTAFVLLIFLLIFFLPGSGYTNFQERVTRLRAEPLPTARLVIVLFG